MLKRASIILYSPVRKEQVRDTAAPQIYLSRCQRASTRFLSLDNSILVMLSPVSGAQGTLMRWRTPDEGPPEQILRGLSLRRIPYRIASEHVLQGHATRHLATRSVPIGLVGRYADVFNG
jgi:hypothetical protein